MLVKSMLIWLSIIPLAIANAGLREKIMTPLIGADYSLPMSGVTLCLLIFIISFVFVPKLGPAPAVTYGQIGLLWVMLTLMFETGMGFYMGKTFSEILKAYDITTGNLWVLVVLFIGCAPYLVAQIRPDLMT